MRYPKLSDISRKSELVTSFGGYHHRENASVNTFYDMCDLTSDKYPGLSSRNPRGKLVVSPASGLFSDNGIIRFASDEIQSAANANEKTVFCTKTSVYVNGTALSDVTLTDISPKKHRIVPFGRNFFIYPDGIYINLNSDGTYTAKRGKYSYQASNVLLTLCNELGNAISFDNSGSELPSSPSEGDNFLLTGDNGAYVYTYTDGIWSDGMRVYIKAQAGSIGRYAYEGEVVNLDSVNGRIIKAVVSLYSSNMLLLLPEGSIPDSVVTAGGQLIKTLLTVFRKMPELDIVCEHCNRLWGCRYGDDGEGNFVNEIYSSKQGDPTVWNSFEGISTDSYSVSLGCTGEFTGACTLDGEVLFFKEDNIIKVSGSVPGEYCVSVIPARGVQKDAADTLVIVNEKAFYKSRQGITVYDGALPYVISEALGELEYSGVCAATEKGKYYIKISEEGKNAILVYDTLTGLWHRESDNENICFFVNTGGKLFALCKSLTPAVSGANEYTVWAMNPGKTTPFDIFGGTYPSGTEFSFSEENLSGWYAVTGNVCSKYSGTKFVRSVALRISGDESTSFKVFVHCNNEAFFREICTVDRLHKGLSAFSINTPVCEGFEIKISGKGKFVLHSLNIVTENAGEVN